MNPEKSYKFFSIPPGERGQENPDFQTFNEKKQTKWPFFKQIKHSYQI